MATKKKDVAAVPVFTRETLAASKKYAAKRDAIMVALKEGREYTLADVDAALHKFLSQPVNEKRIEKE